MDWTGTSPQVKGGINTPLSFCKSNVYAALRSVMPADVPNCHGYTRPIHVVAPEGSLVNARYPAPCGARGITGYRMVDCIFGALAQAVPDKVAADGAGGSTLPSFGGWDGKKRFVFSECIMGTWGATAQHDGQEGVPAHGFEPGQRAGRDDRVGLSDAHRALRIRRRTPVAPGSIAAAWVWRANIAFSPTISTSAFARTRACMPPHGFRAGQPGAPAMQSAFAPVRRCSRCHAMPVQADHAANAAMSIGM